MNLLYIFIPTILHFLNPKISTEFNAGVMPYSVDENGEVYFLLGEEYQEYWEDFIGKSDEIDNGNIIETAIREFIEETNCFFNKNEIKEKIHNASPIKLNKNTYRYIIEIEKIDTETLSNRNPKCNNVEKVKYCWIKATNLIIAIDSAKDDKHVFLPCQCNGKTNLLDKKMRKNLLKGTESRNQIEVILNQKRI